MVLGGGAQATTAEKVAEQTGDVEDQIFVESTSSKPDVSVSSSLDSDDTMSYFAKLADDAY